MSVHATNCYFGWGLLLSGFLTGAPLGLFFFSEKCLRERRLPFFDWL